MESVGPVFGDTGEILPYSVYITITRMRINWTMTKDPHQIT